MGSCGCGSKKSVTVSSRNCDSTDSITLKTYLLNAKTNSDFSVFSLVEIDKVLNRIQTMETHNNYCLFSLTNYLNKVN